MSQKANDTQVGGDHYRTHIQHWDYVAANNLDYFQGQITKYITRWKRKNGMADLLKAKHFLDKYIELQTPRESASARFESAIAEAEYKATRGELHGSITVPGKGEVTMGKFCTCATDPMFCALHEAGPTSAYVNQG